MTKVVAERCPCARGETRVQFHTRRSSWSSSRWIALVIGVIFGVSRWNFAMAHEETDDAQVEGHISPVLPRVSGYVTRVLVVDNQRVTAGQALIEIDPKELDLKVAEAQAALQNALADKATAEAALASARAAAATAAANVETARVRERKAASDLARDSGSSRRAPSRTAS